MKKKIVYREVELDTSIDIDEATSSFWRNVEYWLKKNGFTKDDIVGDVSLSLETMGYTYSVGEYPALCANFYTLETDKEFNERVAKENKAKQDKIKKELKEYERLKKKFDK